MATYIAVDDDLPYHHKTARLAKLAGVDLPTAIGCLQLFWFYVLKVAWRTGDLSAYGDDLIESACYWRGESGRFIKALRECGKPLEDGGRGPGFLDGYVVHNWGKRHSKLIRDRIYREERRSGIEAPPDSQEAKEIMSLWNDYAKAHALAHASRPPRLRGDITSSGFKLLLDSAASQPFLHGAGKDKWRMDLEWLLRKHNYDKVLSGVYKDFEATAPSAAHDPVADYRQMTRDILAKRQAKAA